MFRCCSLKTSHPRLLPQSKSLFCSDLVLAWSIKFLVTSWKFSKLKLWKTFPFLSAFMYPIPFICFFKRASNNVYIRKSSLSYSCYFLSKPFTCFYISLHLISSPLSPYFGFGLLAKFVSDSFWPHGLHLTRPLCPWGFSRQEYRSELPYTLPGDIPNPGLEHRSPTLQVDSLTFVPPGNPISLF